jgi:DNA helicase-2/ATP-dependent DNA helicase PcrA
MLDGRKEIAKGWPLMTNWSPRQQRIFDFIEHETGSAVVCAVAGSGKTTTIVEAANRVPVTFVSCFVAFNRSIADELAKRLPKGFPAKTLNGFGFSAWMQHTGKRKFNLDAQKTQHIIGQKFTKDDFKMYGKGVAQLVSKAKAVGIVPDSSFGQLGYGLLPDTEQNWFNLLEQYEIHFEKDAVLHRAVELARKVLTLSIQQSDNIIDFDDQIYMPVISRARIKQHDILFVDEAQDVNNVQRAMLRLALKPSGRLIAVGDPRQAIYGFRGADTNSINNIKSEFNAIELPLDISYRCPKAVVAEAQKVVSHIQSADSAPEGSVTYMDTFNHKTFIDTDGIVCRNAAPLISLAYGLIKNQKACRVLGREIGQGLVKLIEKMNASNIADLQDSLRTFAQREIAKFVAKGNESAAAAIEDKIETIQVFIDNLRETEYTIGGLLAQIDSLFTDNHAGVTTLCTVHKAKGLEWPRVFILDPHRMPSPYARQAWQMEQEENIRYVAITRAQQDLVYVTLENFEKKVRK